MRKITTSFTAFLFAMILISANVGCKKDKDEEKSKTELLTSGQWKISAMTLTPGSDWDMDGDIDTDLYSLLDACDKDDYLVFSTNGSVEYNEGATKCDQDDPQSESDSWSFTDNETKINLDGDIYTIDELTSSRFRISLTEDDETLTLTLTK